MVAVASYNAARDYYAAFNAPCVGHKDDESLTRECLDMGD